MTATGTIDRHRASSPTAIATIVAAGRPTDLVPSGLRHAEREPAPTWMRAVGSVVGAAGLVLMALVLDWPGSAPEIALLVPAVVAIVVGACVLAAETGLDITDDTIVVRFRPLRPVRIHRGRIRAIRLVEADAQTFGGLGLRVGRGSRAVLLTPGLGLEVTEWSGRTWFVRTSRPEHAFRALAGRSAHLPGGTVPVERERIS